MAVLILEAAAQVKRDPMKLMEVARGSREIVLQVA